jgi:hypothetical protein
MQSSSTDDRRVGPSQDERDVRAWRLGICAMRTEYVAAQVFLDDRHVPPRFVMIGIGNASAAHSLCMYSIYKPYTVKSYCQLIAVMVAYLWYRIV